MSWLRNHLRHFVLPGIHTLARAHGKPMTAADIKPRDKEIRPASDCKYVEAGLLYSLVSSVMRKGDPLREVTLGLCRQIGQGKDAEFVYAIDKRGDVKNLGAGYDGVEGPTYCTPCFATACDDSRGRCDGMASYSCLAATSGAGR